MFLGLGWSFDKPEASDASWGAHWRRPQVRPTQTRKELILVSASSKLGALPPSILAATLGRGY